MKPVLIVGGGISGLSTAYWLTKLGVPCEVVERSQRFGGLISSEITPFGLVETAANGFLAQSDILDLCNDIGVELAPRNSSRKRKFIYRKRPTRWPLTLKESWDFAKGILTLLFKRRKFFEIKDRQTVSEWAEERFGPAASEWLIAPALQGVYAGNPQRMSARLILEGRVHRAGRKRSRLKGTLAPKHGMGDLIRSLEVWLSKRGVSLSKGKEVSGFDSSQYSALVVATSSFDLKSLHEKLSPLIPALEVESLPLVSATLFFDPAPADIKGFGCLFPRREGFYSLGVLFNDCIFDGRSPKRSETWILGGAFRKDVTRFSDEEILRQIKEDRKRLYKLSEHAPVLHSKVTRWDKALPHMNLDLEDQIEKLNLPKGIYLSGNYMGKIGLSQIVSRNKDLALRVKEDMAL